MFKKKQVKCYIWSITLYGAEIWTPSESRSETPGKFRNVLLKKDGEDQLDRLCEKGGILTQSEGGEEYRTYSKTKEG